MKHLLSAALVLATYWSSALADPPQNFVLHETPREVPEIGFADGQGREVTLEDFRGRTVLLNVWATWCPPCVEEMPTLDALQAELGGDGFEVVALSIDRAGPGAVRTFFEQTGVEHLGLYIDETGRASSKLGVLGLPATLLIDEEGRELGRLIGPAEWDEPEMVDFLRGLAARGGKRAIPAEAEQYALSE